MKKINTVIWAFVLLLAYPGPSRAVVLTITNNILKVDVDAGQAVLSVTDKRINKVWSQEKERSNWPVVTGYSVSNATDPKTITVNCADSTNAGSLKFNVQYSLSTNTSELLVTMTPVQEAVLSSCVDFPHPFAPEAGTDIILAHRIGMAIPVNEPDTTVVKDFARKYTSHGGDGCSMPFYGIVRTNDGASVMTTLLTPYDGVFKIVRTNGMIRVTPGWNPQLGQLGYARQLRYSFFTSGGHVTIAKRYRQMIQPSKVTLDTKISQRPALARMTGAATFTTGDWKELSLIGQTMAAEGITNVFWWQDRISPSAVTTLTNLGYLVTRYDAYSDVAAPDDIPYLTCVLSHMMKPAAFPQDIMMNSDGSYINQWLLTSADSTNRFAKGVAYNRRYNYASKRFSKMFQTLPFNCIYLDTEAAAPIQESWAAGNVFTRSQATNYKISFYNSVRTNFNKVIGLEGGLFVFAPYVDYFYGNRTLIPFTVSLGGTHEVYPDDYVIEPAMAARLAKSHKYYIPLWALVFGDSVHLYGAYSPHNIVDQPLVWDKEDAISILYGMPNSIRLPTTGAYSYLTNKMARIKASYEKVNFVGQLRGTSLMENHEYLTANRDVQRTTFANGLQVTVNFGAAPYTPQGSGIPIGQYEFFADVP